MSRQVRASPGAAYDLGYHVVWCPKCWRRALGGRIKARLEELIRARAAAHDGEIIALEVVPDHVHLFVRPYPEALALVRGRPVQGVHLRPPAGRVPAPALPACDLWSRSYSVASVGAVSVADVPRSIETPDERVPGNGGGADA
ncbi:IS200/IS605 family transposase [Nonomuraea sp. NPDC003707]